VNRVQALLVDLDGTLVDTREANYRAYAAALAEIGIEIDRAAFEQVSQGRNWREFLPGLMTRRSDVDPMSIATRKAALYPAQLETTVVNHALVALINRGHITCKTALVTTASAISVQAVLGHHQLSHLFDIVVTGNDVARHKPDPQAYHLAATKLGCDAADCLVFEDSDSGVEAAARFGAHCLRVSFVPSA
jgi:beta-phosphoglucomutase